MASNDFNPSGSFTQAYAVLKNADGTTPASPSSAATDATGVAKAPVYTFLGAQLSLACDAAVSLTVPTGTRYAQIQAAVQNVRYRYGADGGTITPTNPTATLGMRIPVNSELACDVATIANMRFIAETAGALLNVSYFS